MASKLLAAQHATGIGVAVVFGLGGDPSVVREAARGEVSNGTFFPAKGSVVESRKRWLMSGMTKKDAGLVVDDGAVRALREQSRSLLPAGIREVNGRFVRGDVVEVLSESGSRLAYGIANYDSSEMRKIAGARSDRIMELLGHHNGDEAVHRNNMVVV
jgi:glutamate 5-kinase